MTIFDFLGLIPLSVVKVGWWSLMMFDRTLKLLKFDLNEFEQILRSIIDLLLRYVGVLLFKMCRLLDKVICSRRIPFGLVFLQCHCLFLALRSPTMMKFLWF